METRIHQRASGHTPGSSSHTTRAPTRAIAPANDDSIALRQYRSAAVCPLLAVAWLDGTAIHEQSRAAEEVRISRSTVRSTGTSVVCYARGDWWIALECVSGLHTNTPVVMLDCCVVVDAARSMVRREASESRGKRANWSSDVVGWTWM